MLGRNRRAYATIEGVKTGLQALRVRKAVNLPMISTYSFRHKVTTVLRQAQVSEDQVSQMLGHRRVNLRTTGGYWR
jgi:integrase